jgi:hypothetical protein
MSTLVVFGASGNVGWHVLQGTVLHVFGSSFLHALMCLMTLCVLAGMLKADPATLDGQSICKIRAVTRDPTSLRARLALSENMEVEIVKGELSTQGITEIAPILEGATRVFVCLPQPLSSADMVHVSKALVDEAKRAGVKHIVRLSSARIDAHSLGLCYPSQGPLGEAHEAGEKYTKEQGIGLTSVRPTSFSSNFVKYDLPSVKARAEFCSPLGETASGQCLGVRDTTRHAHMFVAPIPIPDSLCMRSELGLVCGCSSSRCHRTPGQQI